MIIGMRNPLILAPHTDDAELGCGGTISRYLERGAQVFVAAFSTAGASLPPGAPPTTLRDEFLASMKVLGVPESNCFVFDYPVRHLPAHRQELLDGLLKLRREIDPEVVFLPSESDLHQDHQVVYHEGLRAFKDMTMLGYELPWNHITFSAEAFVTLEQRHLQRKWAALSEYKSQFQLARSYFSEEFIRALAMVRGTQVRAPFAEAFEVIKIRS